MYCNRIRTFVLLVNSSNLFLSLAETNPFMFSQTYNLRRELTGANLKEFRFCLLNYNRRSTFPAGDLATGRSIFHLSFVLFLFQLKCLITCQ